MFSKLNLKIRKNTLDKFFFFIKTFVNLHIHFAMEKGILKFWLFLMIFYQTEVHEFLAIPFFFHHYYETLQYQPQTSIKNFFEDHYLENSHQEPEHQKLPFKFHNHTLFVSFIGSDIFQPLKITLVNQNFYKVPHFFESGIPILFLDTIWQPPKHV